MNLPFFDRKPTYAKPSKLKKKVKMAVPNAERTRLHRERAKCEEQIYLLRHPQGKSYTLADNRQAILTYYRLKQDNLRGNQKRKSDNELIRDVAWTLGRGRRLLVTVIRHYVKTLEVYVASGGARGHFFHLFSIYLLTEGDCKCVKLSRRMLQDVVARSGSIPLGLSPLVCSLG